MWFRAKWESWVPAAHESFLARKLTIDGKIRDEVLESGIELQENNVSP